MMKIVRLTYMYSERMKLFKIGITSNPVYNRRNTLRRQYDDPTIDVRHTRACQNRREADAKEKLLHQIFHNKLEVAFNDNGIERKLGKEWFRLSELDLVFIRSSKLFIQFQDSFMFHPMAFLQYATTNKD
ncbi:MAG: GIY-YIG nuclease family protein [Chloroflexota bacterium]